MYQHVVEELEASWSCALGVGLSVAAATGQTIGSIHLAKIHHDGVDHSWPRHACSSHGILLSSRRFAGENGFKLIMILAGGPIGRTRRASVCKALFRGSLPVLGPGFERGETKNPTSCDDDLHKWHD